MLLLMTHLILLSIAALLALVLICLVVTWYHADDGKLFGPVNDRRVTFKAVLLGFLRDFRDVFALHRVISFGRRLWAFWGPRLTNRALLAVIMADITIVASGQDVWTFISGHPTIVFGIVLLHLLTPLSPAGAPAKLPPSVIEPGGLRSPGAEAEANGQLGAVPV
jgi:hypothetical protein